jgi:hypothetical protein
MVHDLLETAALFAFDARWLRTSLRSITNHVHVHEHRCQRASAQAGGAIRTVEADAQAWASKCAHR